MKSSSPFLATRTEATRELLIRNAEALFGKYGFGAVSLRTIMSASAQNNSNVVQYHFGDKFGLLEAIFDYRAAQIAPVRQKMLEDARICGRLTDIKTLLRCIITPELEIWRRDGNINYTRLTIYYMLFLRPKGIAHPFDRNSAATRSLRNVYELLHARLPHLALERFEYRLSIVDTALLMAMTSIVERVETMEPFEILLEDALEMMAAAISAPPWIHHPQANTDSFELKDAPTPLFVSQSPKASKKF